MRAPRCRAGNGHNAPCDQIRNPKSASGIPQRGQSRQVSDFEIRTSLGVRRSDFGVRCSAKRLLARAARRDTSIRGFTLLEVVLALGLFFGALAVLAQVLWNASRASIQGRLRAEGLIRCESKLAEVVAGIIPAQSQGPVPFSSDPLDHNWTWQVITETSAKAPSLLHVQVIVAHSGQSSQSNASVSLQRWMRDPNELAAVAEEAALQAEENANGASASSSSSGSSSSGSSSGGSR